LDDLRRDEKTHEAQGDRSGKDHQGDGDSDIHVKSSTFDGCSLVRQKLRRSDGIAASEARACRYTVSRVAAGPNRREPRQATDLTRRSLFVWRSMPKARCCGKADRTNKTARRTGPAPKRASVDALVRAAFVEIGIGSGDAIVDLCYAGDFGHEIFGRVLLASHLDRARERNLAVLDLDADVARIDVRIIGEPFANELPQQLVAALVAFRSAAAVGDLEQL